MRTNGSRHWRGAPPPLNISAVISCVDLPGLSCPATVLEKFDSYIKLIISEFLPPGAMAEIQFDEWLVRGLVQHCREIGAQQYSAELRIEEEQCLDNSNEKTIKGKRQFPTLWLPT